MHGPEQHKNAFSLVELSIVLVILGLLVGGVLSGQSLIHAAELRSVPKEYNELVTSTQTFTDKYFYLPGDMPNATQFWQKEGGLVTYAAGCLSNSGAAVNSAAQQGACDGDGNGRIETNSTLGVTEDAQFWEHLAMAGLLTMKVGQADPDHGIGINKESQFSNANSRFPNALWSAFYFPPAVSQYMPIDVALTGGPMNLFEFGAFAGLTQPPHLAVLSPQDAWNIDSKIDDGKATTGKVRATYEGYGTCNTGDAYALTSTTIGCSLIFTSAF